MREWNRYAYFETYKLRVTIKISVIGLIFFLFSALDKSQSHSGIGLVNTQYYGSVPTLECD